MAIIYLNGHWSNQSEKIDDILLLIDSEIKNIERILDLQIQVIKNHNKMKN
jgi:hypothetical protein